MSFDSPLFQRKGSMFPLPGEGVGGIDLGTRETLIDDQEYATHQHHADPDYSMPFGQKGTEPEGTKYGTLDACPVCRCAKNLHMLGGCIGFDENGNSCRCHERFNVAPHRPGQSPEDIEGSRIRDAWDSPAHRASKTSDNSVCVCGHQWHEHWHQSDFGCKSEGKGCKCRGFRSRTAAANQSKQASKGPTEASLRAARLLVQLGQIKQSEINKVALEIDRIVSEQARGQKGDVVHSASKVAVLNEEGEQFRAELKWKVPGIQGYLFRSDTYCPSCGQEAIDMLLDRGEIGPPGPDEDTEWIRDSDIVPQPLIFVLPGTEACIMCGRDINSQAQAEPLPGNEITDEDRAYLKEMNILGSLKGLTERVTPVNPLFKEPDPETATFFKESEGDKPHCPHCGSDDYVLMPTDFETAKCNKCGKNWHHGIVEGINDPKTASEKSYGAGTPLGGTANGTGQPAPGTQPTKPAQFQQPEPAPTNISPVPQTGQPGQSVQFNIPPAPPGQSRLDQDTVVKEIVRQLQEKMGAAESAVRIYESPETLPPRIELRKHLDPTLVDEEDRPPFPLGKGAGWTGEEEEEDDPRDVTDLGTRYGQPLGSKPDISERVKGWQEDFRKQVGIELRCLRCNHTTGRWGTGEGAASALRKHYEAWHPDNDFDADFTPKVLAEAIGSQGQHEQPTGGEEWLAGRKILRPLPVPDADVVVLECPICRKRTNDMAPMSTSLMGAETYMQMHYEDEHPGQVPEFMRHTGIIPPKKRFSPTKEDRKFMRDIGIKGSKTAAGEWEAQAPGFRCPHCGMERVLSKENHMREFHPEEGTPPGLRGFVDKWSPAPEGAEAETWWKRTTPDERRKMAGKLGIEKYWTSFVWGSLPPEIQEKVIGMFPQAMEPPLDLTDEDRKMLGDMNIRAAGESRAWDPNMAKQRYDSGCSLADKGDLDGAVREFSDSIRLNPYYGPAHFRLGIAFGQEGDESKSLEELKLALRAHPKDEWAYHAICTTLESRGELDSLPQAVRDFLDSNVKSKQAAAGKQAEKAETWWRSCETCGKPALELKKGQNARGPVWCAECSGKKASIQTEEGVNQVCPNCHGTETKPVDDPEAEDGNLMECLACGAFFAK